MQNEISPRWAADENAPRRGVQQAGRIGRAIGKESRSFTGLRKHRRNLSFVAGAAIAFGKAAQAAFLLCLHKDADSLFGLRPNSAARS